MEEERILKIIFEAREEDLARLDEEDENFMQKDEANRNKKYYLNGLKDGIKLMSEIKK